MESLMTCILIAVLIRVAARLYYSKHLKGAVLCTGCILAVYILVAVRILPS
jgi:hypothetical protein